MTRILAFLMAILAASPSAAEDRAVTAAEAASVALGEAVIALEEAQSAKDRVAALTRTIQAYDAGLGALRDALRRASVREAEITADFEARRGRIAALLGVMTAIEKDPEPLLLMHPDGPLGTARSGMILASVAPALQAESELLRAQLQELKRLRELQDSSALTLEHGLHVAQEARTALSQAMQDRTGLPRRFLEDPEELQSLVDSSASLDAFAVGLAGLETDIGAPMADFEGAKGTLPLPAQGRILRRAGEADAAGIARPGILLATRPAALVTAPWPATVRYRGPLLDYGNVMIIEPATGYLLILAGLTTVFGETGDIVEAGAPLGLMGGAPSGVLPNSPTATESGGAERTETLYMELRQGKDPVDPGPWFIETRDD
ncbi:MAG: peptidoglycan DD-metalloendopeptidase family protein [Paracoccaceae bacterium]